MCEILDHLCFINHLIYAGPFQHTDSALTIALYFREPDFSSLVVGSRVLARIGDSKVWKPTVIEDITSDEQVLVKHEGNFAPVLIHDILPLTSQGWYLRIWTSNTSIGMGV